jgi:hypothetical protein
MLRLILTWIASASLAGSLVGNRATGATIETVPVLNPGNPDDSTGFGGVTYSYRMGTNEVTNASYAEFLNQVDAEGADAFDLYNPFMQLNSRGGIEFDAAAPDAMKYRVKEGRDRNPVVYVTWFSALRFANWLHNGQGASSTESGAYTLLGGTAVPTNAGSIMRTAGARWFIPSEDEWYKAAFH